uniref:Deoxyguanosine kinase n=1 Tax=Coturnix japonica TaxID=93934 RepID=A0A8C2YBK1_COTJA
MTSPGSSEAPPPHLHGIGARRHRERRSRDGAERDRAAPGAGGKHRRGQIDVPAAAGPRVPRVAAGGGAGGALAGSGGGSGAGERREVRGDPASCAGLRLNAARAPQGGNLLQRLYRDPARWAFTFQTLSCLGRLRAQLERPLGPVRVSERSVYSDRYVFAKSLFEAGQLDAVEWAVYQEWHTFLVGQLGAHTAPHAFLYLRASPQRCLERLRGRARPEEQDVTLRYLQQLHAQHERWLLERSAEVHFAEVRHTPVLVLDVEGDFEHDAAAQDALMARVEDFVKDLQDGAEPQHPEGGHMAGTAAGH